jgi:hypothetical protein
MSGQPAGGPYPRHRRRARLGGRTAFAAAAKATAIMFMVALSIGVWQTAPPETGVWQPGSASAGLATWEGQGGGRTVASEPPTRLRIPAIGVDAALVTIGLGSDGRLAAPQDYDRPGWYAGGTAPGQTGPAVIAGHVDSLTGPAVFARLHQLQVGDLVDVARGAGWVRFAVTELAWYPKTSFPTRQVYGPTPDAQLRLVTCGGSFDSSRRSYTDNLVVYAVAT